MSTENEFVYWPARVSCSSRGVNVIEDKGKGFSLAEPCTLVNGLINMRKRAEAIKGTFEISSQPGKGTRIELRVAVRNSLQA